MESVLAMVELGRSTVFFAVMALGDYDIK